MRFSPGCCCPGSTTCAIGSDDFNRASLGSDWTQDAGPWSLSGNKLTTSSTSAALKYNTAHPDAESEHWVHVKVKAANSGDKLRVLVAYTDSGDHIAVEYEAGISGALRIFEVGGAGQLATTDIYAPEGDEHDLWVCYTETATSGTYECKAYFLENSTGLQFDYGVTATSTVSANNVGLGTGGTLAGACTFDNFTYRKHASSTNPDCDTCADGPTPGDCSFCSDGQPQGYKIVITDLDNGSFCSHCETTFQGTYYIGFMDSGTPCDWIGALQDSGVVCVAPRNTQVSIDMELSDQGGGNYRLEVRLNIDDPDLGAVDVLKWRKTFVGKPDCKNWSSESLSDTSGTGLTTLCDHGSSSTAEVTSIPA